MTRRERILLVAGVLLFASGWLLGKMWQPARRDFVLEAGGPDRAGTGCRVPVTVLNEKPAWAGAVIVFHGLAANRRVMMSLGDSLSRMDASVYLVDLPGHGDNTEAFSFTRAEQCAAAVVDSLATSGKIQLPRTALVGHSMGGAIAVRLAERFTTAATIAIAPAPMVPLPHYPPGLVPYSLPHRMPNNLLVFSGGLEPPSLPYSARELVKAAGQETGGQAGGERYQREDFQERRALRYISIPFATHTSLLVSSRVQGEMAYWLMQAAPGGVGHNFHVPAFSAQLLPFAAGTLGLLLLFAGVTTILAKLTGAEPVAQAAEPAPRGEPVPPGSAWRTAVGWLMVAGIGVAVLKFVVPLRWLAMFSGDYLASCFLIIGVVLLAWLARSRAPNAAASQPGGTRVVLVGFGMGLATMLALGAWLNWQITDAWLNAPRWWRFVVLVPAMLPYCLAEEWALGAAGSGWRARLLRYIRLLVLRGLLWAVMVAAIFVLNNGQVLIFLMALYLAMFSIAQRAGADVVLRRTGSAAAAAVFSAILAAWFVAAVFPLT